MRKGEAVGGFLSLRHQVRFEHFFSFTLWILFLFYESEVFIILKGHKVYLKVQSCEKMFCV